MGSSWTSHSPSLVDPGGDATAPGTSALRGVPTPTLYTRTPDVHIHGVIAFSDAPYRFFDARPSTPLIHAARIANRHLVLPGPGHRVREVVLSGETARIRETWRDNKRLIFVSNHPTHSDPQVLTEVQRRLGVDGSFMAAYDVFLRGRLQAFFMQRLGNFSVDREGSDRKAMSAAIQIVREGQRALNIFPEGNVFLTNDRLMPLLDGTAFIALKAQAALDGSEVLIVPVSMKFTHLTRPRKPLRKRLIDLAEHSGHRFPEGSEVDPVAAVLGLGRHIIGAYLRTHGDRHALEPAEAGLYETLEAFAASLVDDLESALEIKALPGMKLLDRIGKVRSRLHQLRTDPALPQDSALDGMADRALLALRVHGYTSPYLTARPTVDRYDETVERIAEDYHSRAMPRTGPRRAMVRIHPPLSVREFLEQKDGSLKATIPALTKTLSQTIQGGIDELNDRNDAPGGELLAPG